MKNLYYSLLLVTTFLFSINYSIGRPENQYNTLNKTKETYYDDYEFHNMVFSLGYGPSIWKKRLYDFNQKATVLKGIGPAYLKFEFPIMDKLGMGLCVNYVNVAVHYYTFDNIYNKTDHVFYRKSLAFNLRFNYHIYTVNTFDLYVGMGLGYKKDDVSWSNDSVVDHFQEEREMSSGTYIYLRGMSKVGFESTIGMRYYFKNNIGIYTEFGLAKSVVQGGLIYKL